MARDIHATQNFVGGAKITGLPAASASGEAVTYEQLNAAQEAVSWKDNVRAASTGNLTLSGPGASVDGVTLSNGDRVLAKNQTTASENGIYIFNGAGAAMTRASDASAFAELESAVVVVDEGTSNAGTSWRQTQVNGTIDSSDVVFQSFLASAPAASETTAGIVELATQAEADTGTDDARTVTPLKMANWSGRKRKATGTLGDNSATAFNIDHNWNTRDVQVELYRNSGSYDTVIADVTRPTANRVTVTFASAPGSNQFAYVLIG